MKSEWMITLLTAGGILILCAAMIIWDKIRQRKWFLRHLKQRWGTVPDREYTQEELESISHYAKRNEGEQFMICLLYTSNLDLSKPIGCSSQRRILQLQQMYPEATFKSIRGNVLTRLNKLDGGEYSGLILAAAGLKRLGLEERISRYYEPDEVIPAAGQGLSLIHI